MAQQSLFNVPSLKSTAQGSLFFQEQLNFGHTGESNLTTDAGLGAGLDVGLNVFHVRLYPGHEMMDKGDPAGNAFLANAQWVVSPVPWLNIGVGVQQGLSAENAHGSTEYVGAGWGGFRFEPALGRYGAFVVGGYYGTRAWAGEGMHYGGMVGTEIPLWGERVGLCADWMIGINRASVAVIGLQITPVPEWHWQVAMGAQIPSPGSNTGYGFVLELTRTPGEEEPRAKKVLSTML